MKPLCLIPARGGSKRLHRKNLVESGGRPLIAWTIDAAEKSGIFDQVFVSTEDEEIGEVARQWGAEVPYRRPMDLAGDTVTNVAVADYHARFFENQGTRYEAIVCLQPSSPLRTADQIREAWNKFVKMDADFLIGITLIDPHYFHWALHAVEGNRLELAFGDRYMTVRQKLPHAFRPNGSIKIGKINTLRRRGSFLGPNMTGYEMSDETSVHVATEFDRILANMLLSGRQLA